MEKYPIYIAQINDEMDGITAISLVTEGAVEVDFQMFDKDKPFQTFAIENEEQHLLLGCVMRCDFNIYRRNPDGYEYFIRYDRQTIEKMATKMLKDMAFTSIDLQHNGEMLPKGCVELRELFIKDSTKGIVPNGFDEVNDGSLFAIYHINDENIWQMCKEGTFNSFSLEGYFDVVKSTDTVEMQKNKIENNKERNLMSNIKEALRKILAQFGSVDTDNGTLEYDGDTLEVGADVTIDGNPAPDGEYKGEDGTVIVVKDGKVDSITEPEAEDEEPAEEEEKPVENADEEPVPPTEPETPAEPEKNPEIEALRSELDALKAVVENLKAEVAKITAQPAAEPVQEEFEKLNPVQTNKLSKAVQIAQALRN